MNRNQEFEQLQVDLKEVQPPAKLENVYERAVYKRQQKKRRRLFWIPVGSVVSFMLGFIFMINTFPAFAYACGKIPILKDLAQAVAFSPSLQAAIENEYVQPIGISQTKQDITLTIEYIIVDQKRLEIFYALDSKKYNDLNIQDFRLKSSEGKELENYSSSWSDEPLNKKNVKLYRASVDFFSVGDLPGELQTVFYVDGYDENIDGETVEFHIPLQFDAKFKENGEMIHLNHTFTMAKQALKITDIEIYPTHMRLNLQSQPENTAWITGLECYFSNEKGERFEQVRNGIRSYGDATSPMMDTYMFESDFFSESKAVTLNITKVQWLNKDQEKVRIDLKNKAAEFLPPGVEIQQIKNLQGTSWALTFSLEGASDFQQWASSTYYDEKGKAYDLNSWSSTSGYFHEEKQEYVEQPNQSYSTIFLEGYPYDIVYFSPLFRHVTIFEEPIQIQIK